MLRCRLLCRLLAWSGRSFAAACACTVLCVVNDSAPALCPSRLPVGVIGSGSVRWPHGLAHAVRLAPRPLSSRPRSRRCNDFCFYFLSAALLTQVAWRSHSSCLASSRRCRWAAQATGEGLAFAPSFRFVGRPSGLAVFAERRGRPSPPYHPGFVLALTAIIFARLLPLTLPRTQARRPPACPPTPPHWAAGPMTWRRRRRRSVAGTCRPWPLAPRPRWELLLN